MALGVLAVLALGLGVVVGAGSGSGTRAPAIPAHTASLAPAGYFRRIQILAAAGRGSFAATEQRAESAAINRTLAYTPYVRTAGGQHRELALTFDDGPGPYTPRILSVLQRMHAPATFFEIGVMEQYFHDSTVQIVARGYPIGDHTETHPPMSELSASEQREQLLSEAAAIGRYGAPFPRMFRPPYNLWNSTTLSLLKHYRMLMVLWTVDTSDYALPGVKAIVHAVVTGARPGAIILMHDAGGNRTETVAALPQIIRKLRRRGYKLVTVPRLLLDNPAPRDQDLGGLSGSG